MVLAQNRLLCQDWGMTAPARYCCVPPPGRQVSHFGPIAMGERREAMRRCVSRLGQSLCYSMMGGKWEGEEHRAH